jgi:hypothetical protein
MTNRDTDEAPRAVSVSNRQFVLLMEAKRSGGLTLERLLQLSQSTVGSMVRGTQTRAGCLAWNDGVKRFVLTAAGLTVIEHYSEFDIERRDRTRPLSKWIHMRRAVAEIRKRESAA